MRFDKRSNEYVEQSLNNVMFIVPCIKPTTDIYYQKPPLIEMSESIIQASWFIQNNMKGIPVVPVLFGCSLPTSTTRIN